jgi:copper chaperone CopZ
VASIKAAVTEVDGVTDVDVTYTQGKFGSSSPEPSLSAGITATPAVTHDQLLAMVRTFGAARAATSQAQVDTELTVTVPIVSDAPMSKRTFRQDSFTVTDADVVDAVARWFNAIARFGPYTEARILDTGDYGLYMLVALPPGSSAAEVAATKSSLATLLPGHPNDYAQVTVQR